MDIGKVAELFNLLKLLWPDFGAFWNGEPEGLTVVFWALILLVFSVSFFFVVFHFLRFKKRIELLNSLVKDQNREELAFHRAETEKNALKRDPNTVGPLWREFDESLVLSSDEKQLHNTLDANHFFNAGTLARGLTGSRLLAAAPSFLVALGVLGTFVGLTIGLNSLDLDSRSAVNELRDGIDGLIQGAAVAFMTSVWGVFLSLVLNLVEKLAERSAINRIVVVQHKIDFLYPRIPAEQSLVNIADYSKQSKETLQGLGEQIGKRMQEAVEGMSESMQDAVANALNTVMKPAIDSLVRHSSEQSTTALESLVTRFMEGMGEAGRDQSQLMEKATERMDGAIAGMSDKFGELVRHMDQQRSLQDDQIQRMSETSQQNEQALAQQVEVLLGQFSTQAQEVQRQAQQREQERNQQLQSHLGEVAGSQQNLLAAIAESVSETRNQSLQFADQHKALMAEFSNSLLKNSPY